MKVAILGASDNPERFACKAQKLLESHGHEPIPISLSGKEIGGRQGYSSVLDIPGKDLPVHTVTVYLSPENFEKVAEDVLKILPARIIFNPGTESDEWAARFREADVDVVEACTLVMLDAGEF